MTRTRGPTRTRHRADPSAEDEAGTSGSDPAEDDGGTDVSGQDAEPASEPAP